MERETTVNIKNIGILSLLMVLAFGLIIVSYVGKFRADVLICGITVFFTSLIGVGIFTKHLISN